MVLSVKVLTMNKFNGIVSVSLETRYNKTNVKAEIIVGNFVGKIARIAYNESLSFKQNMLSGARQLALNLHLECQDYCVNYLECQDKALFTTDNAISKVTF